MRYDIKQCIFVLEHCKKELVILNQEIYVFSFNKIITLLTPENGKFTIPDDYKVIITLPKIFNIPSYILHEPRKIIETKILEIEEDIIEKSASIIASQI